jgi:hypothetical protein
MLLTSEVNRPTIVKKSGIVGSSERSDLRNFRRADQGKDPLSREEVENL